MMSRIKKNTVRVANNPKSRMEIIFRALITALEVLPGVFVTLFTEMGMAEKAAVATTIAVVISGIVNVLRESGLLESIGMPPTARTAPRSEEEVAE